MSKRQNNRPPEQEVITRESQAYASLQAVEEHKNDITIRLNEATKDPLALWMNGGPGSSSIAYGFWTEHGPFRLADNGTTVELYEYSWNKKASVLYVEQPSGVGLSWSADQAHHSTNDEQASADNLLFLKCQWQLRWQRTNNPAPPVAPEAQHQ